MTEPSRLERPGGETVAYHASPGSGPTVIFCGGFMSDMSGTKAGALEAFCRDRGQAYLRFDYQGHGQSSGAFAAGTIGRWTGDAVAVIDTAGDGPVVLVGSSMGGWIMLLAALARRERIAALVGVAAAPDFTRRMMREEFDDAQRLALLHQGRVEIASDYDDGPTVITRALIDDGEARCLLDAPIELDVPVRLLHGLQDTAVPWRTALAIAEALVGDDVIVSLIKNGDHRLSEPADLARLCAAVADVSSPGKG